MPNRQNDILFQLIKSLKKAEKRNFKLYVTRNSSKDDLKTIVLFDALDKATEYNETAILQKNTQLKKAQISNLKASLYQHILASLRIIQNDESVEQNLHELLDHARILYKKGLYQQALSLLEKAKKIAERHFQITYLNQILFFEKQIETLHITRSVPHRAEALVAESEQLTERIESIHNYSNASLILYNWYITNGIAKSNADSQEVDLIYSYYLKGHTKINNNFYEQLYYYQARCWYSFINKDLLNYYKYTQKWVQLFEQDQTMLKLAKMHYIKGLYNLLTACFNLRRFSKFEYYLAKFEAFNKNDAGQNGDIYEIQGFIYLYTAKLNYQFLIGEFTNGLSLINEIETQLNKYEPLIDKHRILVLYYKIACLYFGAGNNNEAIGYLQKIINGKLNLRTDLQCYARLLHLIAHYELGHVDLLEYLIKSVYRFMAKMQHLTAIEEAMFQFIKNSFSMTQKQIKPALEALLIKIKKYESKKSENRTFIYLDVVSWIESKLSNKRVEDIIKSKYHLKQHDDVKDF